ncbi:MAG: hypothetical protein P4L82_00595 [Ancalomicrobiaceae bacterium]|nr:hypothetical protein [Ancalomicrobiaceae bacterium]
MRQILIAALFISVGPAAAEPQKLDCSTFPADASHESLVAALGKDNVAIESIPGAEGQDTETTVLYPKDRTRRLAIFWKDEEAKQGIGAILVRQDDKADPVGWKIGGLDITATLADVEKANGKPFQITGFGWDYGGYSGGWNGGKLETVLGPDCHVSLRFTLPDDVKSGVAAKVSGESQFPSNGAAMRAAKPRLTEITIGFPE